MKTGDLPFVSKLKKANYKTGDAKAFFGTATVTDVRGEIADKDKPRFYAHDSLGTETFTKTRGETTDKDP